MRASTAKAAIAALAVVSALCFAGCASADADSDSDIDSGEEGTALDLADADPNGIEELSSAEIMQQVGEAVDAAESVHLVGEQTQAGSLIELDLQMSTDGDATGTVTSNGVTIKLILVDGATYFSAGEEFWAGQLGPELAAGVGDKFVEVPADEEAFGDFGDFDAFFADLLKAEGDVEKGEETTVEGVSALTLADASDDGELFVSMQGEPLPLEVSFRDDSELLFLDWNEEFVVTAPAEGDVVDLESLVP